MRDESELIDRNRAAWSAGVYDARCEQYGNPQDAAREMMADPEHFLRHTLDVLGELRDKRVLNLLGSNGRKAVPMALLGADVTIVDLSEDNRQYAIETAEAAGVAIDYTVSDAISFLRAFEGPDFDLCLMEGGVLHYFSNLIGLFRGIGDALTETGRLVIHEFHPYRKVGLPDCQGYFDTALQDAPVPVRANDEGPQCLVRYWTISEIWQAIRDSKMTLQRFEELPDPRHPNIPGWILLEISR